MSDNQLISNYRAKRDYISSLRHRLHIVLQMVAYYITESDEYSRYLLLDSPGRVKIDELPDDIAALGISSLECDRRHKKHSSKVVVDNFRANLNDKFLLQDLKEFDAKLSVIEFNYDMTKCIEEDVSYKMLESIDIRKVKYDRVSYDMYLLMNSYSSILNPELLFYIHANTPDEFGIISRSSSLEHWDDLDELLSKKSFVIEHKYNDFALIMDYDCKNLVYNLNLDVRDKERRSILAWLGALSMYLKLRKDDNVPRFKYPHHIFIESSGVNYDKLDTKPMQMICMSGASIKQVSEIRQLLSDYYKVNGLKLLIEQFKVANVYLHFKGFDE